MKKYLNMNKIIKNYKMNSMNYLTRKTKFHR